MSGRGSSANGGRSSSSSGGRRSGSSGSGGNNSPRRGGRGGGGRGRGRGRGRGNQQQNNNSSRGGGRGRGQQRNNSNNGNNNGGSRSNNNNSGRSGGGRGGRTGRGSSANNTNNWEDNSITENGMVREALREAERSRTNNNPPPQLPNPNPNLRGSVSSDDDVPPNVNRNRLPHAGSARSFSSDDDGDVPIRLGLPRNTTTSGYREFSDELMGDFTELMLTGRNPLEHREPLSTTTQPPGIEHIMRRLFAQTIGQRLQNPNDDGAPMPDLFGLGGLSGLFGDDPLAAMFDVNPPTDVRKTDQLVCPTCMRVHLPVEGSVCIDIPKEKEGEDAAAAAAEPPLPGAQDNILVRNASEDIYDDDGSSDSSMPDLESITEEQQQNNGYPDLPTGGVGGLNFEEHGGGNTDNSIRSIDEGSDDSSMPDLESITEDQQQNNGDPDLPTGGVGGLNFEEHGGGGNTNNSNRSNALWSDEGSDDSSMPPLEEIPGENNHNVNEEQEVVEIVDSDNDNSSDSSSMPPLEEDGGLRDQLALQMQFMAAEGRSRDVRSDWRPVENVTALVNAAWSPGEAPPRNSTEETPVLTGRRLPNNEVETQHHELDDISEAASSDSSMPPLASMDDRSDDGMPVASSSNNENGNANVQNDVEAEEVTSVADESSQNSSMPPLEEATLEGNTDPPADVNGGDDDDDLLSVDSSMPHLEDAIDEEESEEEEEAPPRRPVIPEVPENPINRYLNVQPPRIDPGIPIGGLDNNPMWDEYLRNMARFGRNNDDDSSSSTSLPPLIVRRENDDDSSSSTSIPPLVHRADDMSNSSSSNSMPPLVRRDLSSSDEDGSEDSMPRLTNRGRMSGVSRMSSLLAERERRRNGPDALPRGRSNPNARADRTPSNPIKHLRDYGALRVYASASCPICLEDFNPVVALPCGHTLCEEDYKRLGGYLASDKDKLLAEQAAVKCKCSGGAWQGEEIEPSTRDENGRTNQSAIRRVPSSVTVNASSSTQGSTALANNNNSNNNRAASRGTAWCWGVTRHCEDDECAMSGTMHRVLYSVNETQCEHEACYPLGTKCVPDGLGGLWIHKASRPYRSTVNFPLLHRNKRGRERQRYEVPRDSDVVADGSGGVWAISGYDGDHVLTIKRYLQEGAVHYINAVPGDSEIYYGRSKLWVNVEDYDPRDEEMIGEDLLDDGLWLLGSHSKEKVSTDNFPEGHISGDGSGNLWVLGENEERSALILKRFTPDGACESTGLEFSVGACVHGCDSSTSVFVFHQPEECDDFNGHLMYIEQNPQSNQWTSKQIGEGPTDMKYGSDGKGKLWALMVDDDEDCMFWVCDGSEMQPIHGWELPFASAEMVGG